MGQCCAVEKAPSSQPMMTTDGRMPPGTIQRSQEAVNRREVSELRPEDAAKFEEKIASDLLVTVVLSDGTRLACSLRYNSVENKLVIYCETNVRMIEISEISAIMSGPEQLKRIETKARIADDPNVIGIHLTGGNCIPVRFETTDDKTHFINLVKQKRPKK